MFQFESRVQSLDNAALVVDDITCLSQVEGIVQLQVATDKKGSFWHDQCFSKLRNEEEIFFLIE